MQLIVLPHCSSCFKCSKSHNRLQPVSFTFNGTFLLYDPAHKSESLNLFWLKEKMFPHGFGTLQQTCKWPCKLHTTKRGGGSKRVSVWFTFVEQISNKIVSIAFHAFITSSAGYTGYSETQWKKWSSHFSFWPSCSGECMFLKRCTTTQFPIFVWS